MTAKTLTFAVQIGSGGFEVARIVAERLQYRYYDWEVTSQAAREAGVSPEALAAAERVPSFFTRIIERLGTASAYVVDESDPAAPSVYTMDTAIRTLSRDDYRSLIERVVAELADQGGAVIVGHMGQVVLQDRSEVFKVLVTGSPTSRAERLAAEAGLSLEEALTAVKRSDEDRLTFFRKIYRVELLAAPLYDLTVNTDRVTPAAAAELVLTGAAALRDSPREAPTADRT